MSVQQERDIYRAAKWIDQADSLLITAGAGLGVDSGLPDFRGKEGFWRAYPGLRSHGLQFTDMANPQSFINHPRLAWGFYGHRLQLYRRTKPHTGFTLLRRWAKRMPYGSFVFTSNVDGQFQQAGFPQERVAECHGSIHHLQCSANCGVGISPADQLQPDVDVQQCLLLSELPRCPDCGQLLRPNILMFGDWQWDSRRTDHQLHRLEHWRQDCRNPVVIELGAGTAVPTVRYFGEQTGYRLIRINPDEPQTQPQHIGLAMGGLAALQTIDKVLQPAAPA